MSAFCAAVTNTGILSVAAINLPIPRLVAVVAPEPQAPGCTSPTRCDEAWCLGPDSNRHGVAPKGFSYHCSFRCCMRGPCISWSGLYLCRPDIDRSVQPD